MWRTVPERERMTMDPSAAPPRVERTPRRSAPSVTPVAATKTSSPATRSSVLRTRRGRSRLDERLPLLVVPRPEASLHRPAEALDRGGGDDALRRAADPHHQVDTRTWARGGERGRHVAVGDEVHLRADLSQRPRSTGWFRSRSRTTTAISLGRRPSPSRRCGRSRPATRRCDDASASSAPHAILSM